MQAALKFLMVLLGTLAMLLVAGAVYQIIVESHEASRRRKTSAVGRPPCGAVH
jgi:hypothetical protein